MLPVPMANYLVLAGILFVIGVIGVMTRRNAIIILMSVELMLNAANLLLIVFARVHGDMGGQLMVFFVMTVAAAEAAVGLAILVAVFRRKKSIDVDRLNLLKG
ncbi:MAG TPA: NADH-quinone oxidoreductase subunit NuoK [Acidobacteriota bacterium]|nr:NADH-quinone oxidoreductase subunit NuoK [Acidobacteriota bacterium]